MVDMLESEKFKKILERAKYSAGDDAVELVSIAQKLMPEIEKGVNRQFKLFEAGRSSCIVYRISMKDIVKKMNEYHWAGAPEEKISRFAESMSIEALFLIFSSVAWHHSHRIITEINLDAKGQCVGLWFRPPYPNGEYEEPSVESCAEQWMVLYQEA